VVPLLVTLLLAPGAGQPSSGPWTWSLYEHAGAVTLANEIPDTDSIGAVFECAKGSGAAKVSVYPDGARRPEDRFTVSTPVRSPEFTAFLSTGRMVVRSGDKVATITLGAPYQEALRKFTAACGP
jgi:hypothetical protein